MTYTEPAAETGLRVSDLPRGVRPREKMIQGGARGLSHVELLAVILGTGTRKENVLKIAERLIRRYGVASLPAQNPGDLSRWTKTLEAGDPKARVQACQALGDLRREGKAAVAPLIKALGDKDANVRQNVVWAFQNLNVDAKTLKPVVAPLLKDDNAGVRSTARPDVARAA